MHSCCCARVSEALLEGTAHFGTFLARVSHMVWASLLQCGCQSCCAVRVFRKRSSKALRTSAFFLAWARIESCCCCSSVSEALFQGHIYVLREGRFSGFGITSDIDDSSYRAQALFFSMDSKGNVPPFFHLCYAWPGPESCCCSNVSEELFQVLKEGRFSGFGITSDISDSSYRAQALCFSTDLKGNVGPFFRVCFAWPGPESCCRSNVSEALFQGHTTKTACLYLVL